MSQCKIKISHLFFMLLFLIPFLSVGSEKEAVDSKLTQTTDAAATNTLMQGSMAERLDELTEINDNADAPLSKEAIDQILFLAEKQHKDQEYATHGELGELYYSALIEALGNTRDSRAIPYLIKNIGGTAVSRGLLKIGVTTIDPLITKLHSDVVGFRSGAAETLAFFLKSDDKQYLAKTELREKIKKAFIEELKDPRNQNPNKNVEWYGHRARERADVRRSILNGLGCLAEAGDKEALLLIKSAAEKDPYYFDISKKKNNYHGPQNRYMVREEAQKILDRLKANGQTK
jgi:hypothetical protein